MSLGKSWWRTLAWEACLILKARSYASRVDSRPRAYRSEEVKTRNAWKLQPDGPSERRHAPRPLQPEGTMSTTYYADSRKGRDWEHGRTQVVIFQSHPSVPGQVRVPKRDGLEPAREGFGGADVGSERRTEWAKDGHRLRLRVSGRGRGVWKGRGNGICRCFPVCPMAFLFEKSAAGRSELFVPVWITPIWGTGAQWNAQKPFKN